MAAAQKYHVFTTSQKDVFVYVKKKEDITKIPEPDRKKLEPIKYARDIDPNQSILGLPDVERKKANDFVEQQGFAVVKVSIKVTFKMEISSKPVPPKRRA